MDLEKRLNQRYYTSEKFEAILGRLSQLEKTASKSLKDVVP